MRRSVVMLAPRHPSPCDRETALRILDELQLLQRRDRCVHERLGQLRALLDELHVEPTDT